MKVLFSIISTLLQKLGYILIASWRLKNWELSKHLNNIITKNSIDCVFDVGANSGQFYEFLRNEVGYKGHIFSFEPIKTLAEILEDRAQSDPFWHVFPFALGAENGEAAINIMKRDHFSSFLDPDNSHTPEFEDLNVVEYTQATQIKKIDELIPTVRKIFDFNRILLKIDTQGFDLEVIKGAFNSLNCVGAIQCEISMIQIYKNMPDFNASIQTLKKYGFEVSGLFPVTADDQLRIVEFDCVAINTKQSNK